MKALLLGITLMLFIYSMAEGKTLPRINGALAERLIAEATGEAKIADHLVSEPYEHRNMYPEFLVFSGLSDPPAEGSFGDWGVNQWTGDVWDLWVCKRLDTARLRKSIARIRLRFPPDELPKYKHLSQIEPACYYK